MYSKRQGLFVILFACLASGSFSQERLEVAALNRITLDRRDTLIQFYAVKPMKSIKFQLDKDYYWYSQDTILITQNGSDGKILHGIYKIFYPNKNIMEQGQFKYGLKTGQWKSWYPNGILKQSTNWSEGKINGGFQEFDPSARIMRSGSYKNNLFTGHVFVYLQNGSSEKIFYQNGKLVVEKASTEKSKPSNDKKL